MRVAACLGLFFFSVASMGQLEHPKASPAAQVIQKVGFATIEIAYSRPATRGRKIFGDLVPYGRIWRVGANESTKITVDATIDILGNALPAGTYALYAFPEADQWEIVFHKNTTHWGDGRQKYNPDEDAFRVVLKPQESQEHRENFLIAFDHISHDSADLILHWAKTKITIPLNVDTHSIMEGQILSRLSQDPTAQTYYEAARYYVEQDIKHAVALEFLAKALAIGGDTYYFHRVKSLAEAKLGKLEVAIASAEKSLQLAQAQGKDEFVRMNQKNIDLWNKKLKK